MTSTVAAWPMVALGEVARPVERPEIPVAGKLYRQVGVRLWGQGAYEREPVDGGATQYKTLSRIEADDIIVNKIWARNGSVSVVTPELAGAYVSGEFPTFEPARDRLLPQWFFWLTKTRPFWEQCDEQSRGTSGKNRIRPEKFLQIRIPLPPLEEQRRIVGRIEALAERIAEARGLRRAAMADMKHLLLGRYQFIIEDAPLKRMNEVAPLVRRPVKIETSEEYPELGVRSFGKGTFHKPPLPGTLVGTKKLFAIEPGDLLFNIVFAWEGAVAVAKPEDTGRVGSHRFLTCVPAANVARASFLRFHFLTDEGLRQLGEASPGGAGRNRTLGLKALESIEVPVPSIEAQLWFEQLLNRMNEINQAQAEVDVRLDALLPSALDRAFRGES